jgi:hypothetical protein
VSCRWTRSRCGAHSAQSVSLLAPCLAWEVTARRLEQILHGSDPTAAIGGCHQSNALTEGRPNMRTVTENDRRKLIAGVIASVALVVGCGAEDPAQAPGNQEILRPAQPEVRPVPEGLPAGYVETPLGHFHQSCVHEVPDGGEVDTDGAIWMHGQKMRAPSPCAYESFRVDRAEVVREIDGDDIVLRSHGLPGWVVSVEASANNLGVFPPRFNGLEGTMIVPRAPTVKLFQLIYLFVSLTPADGKAILQPVLQWGGENGQKWMAAGWLVTRTENAYHSALVNVTPGESIR